jgi:hypothetical protein
MLEFVVRVMTSRQFGFNAIVVADLLKLTFEFSSIFKDNKLIQAANLILALTVSNHPVAGSIIVRARSQCVLSGALIVQGSNRCTKTMTQRSDFSVLGGSKSYFFRSRFIN